MKLGTQDRLHNVPPGTKCLLCNAQLETHEHLIFECHYSHHLWHNMSRKGVFSTPITPWGSLVAWLSSHWKGKSLLVISWKLFFFCSVIRSILRDKKNVHTTRGMPQDLQEGYGSKTSQSHIIQNKQSPVGEDRLWEAPANLKCPVLNGVLNAPKGREFEPDMFHNRGEKVLNTWGCMRVKSTIPLPPYMVYSNGETKQLSFHLQRLSLPIWGANQLIAPKREEE